MSPTYGKEKFPVSNPVFKGTGGLTRASTTPLDLSVPYVPNSAAVVEANSLLMTRLWLEFFRRLVGTVNNVAVALGSIPSANSGSIAQQPTGLGPSQAGLIYTVTAPYNHTMVWNGTVWEFYAGDCGSGWLAPFLVLPGTPANWQECDGTATDYLAAGGTSLVATPFTTPDLKTTNRYLRGAAVANQLVAAQAAGITLSGAITPEASHVHNVTVGTHQHGVTGLAHTHTGTTDGEGNHTHGFNVDSGIEALNAGTSGLGLGVGGNSHHHNVSGTTNPGSLHSHTFTTNSGGGGGTNTDPAGAINQNTSAGSSHTHAHTLAAVNDLGSVPLTYTVRFYFRR